VRISAQLRCPGQLLGNSLRITNFEFDTRNDQAAADMWLVLLSAPAVLELLISSKDRVVPKKEVEGYSDEIILNATEVYVHRVPKKLLRCRAGVQVLTVRGIGYLIAEEKECVRSTNLAKRARLDSSRSFPAS
jgi:DNA-binding response OmpR family regulator